jgi:hypothetical protein
MSHPENRDAWLFVVLGIFMGAIAGAAVASIVAYGNGFVAGAARGRCQEACVPEKLIEQLTDGACRCERDRIVRVKGKPEPAP